MEDRRFLVFRTDEQGVRYLVTGQIDLDEDAASAIVTGMTRKGHKQTYEALSYSPGDLDRVLMDNRILVT